MSTNATFLCTINTHWFSLIKLTILRYAINCDIKRSYLQRMKLIFLSSNVDYINFWQLHASTYFSQCSSYITFSVNKQKNEQSIERNRRLVHNATQKALLFDPALSYINNRLAWLEISSSPNSLDIERKRTIPPLSRTFLCGNEKCFSPKITRLDCSLNWETKFGSCTSRWPASRPCMCWLPSKTENRVFPHASSWNNSLIK